MNMYTNHDYRRNGIAYKILDLFVNEAKKSVVLLLLLKLLK